MTSEILSTRSNDEYVPLRVRAWLRTPVVSDVWLPLDGILLYQAVRDDIGRRVNNVPGASLMAQPKNGEMIGRLPLKTVHAKDWYYRCSWAQWGPNVDGQDAWSKRFDQTYSELIDFSGKRGVVHTSRGTYKGYRTPIFYRSALYVEWYCVGEAERIRYLLSTVSHIGKKTVQGWGRVIRWDIDEISEDWSVWKDGRLMRGIPRYHWPRELGNPQTGWYGIRPSYWDRRNQMELVIPDNHE
jgi:CRISPR type IV-associated protein Csf3